MVLDYAYTNTGLDPEGVSAHFTGRYSLSLYPDSLVAVPEFTCIA